MGPSRPGWRRTFTFPIETPACQPKLLFLLPGQLDPDLELIRPDLAADHAFRSEVEALIALPVVAVEVELAILDPSVPAVSGLEEHGSVALGEGIDLAREVLKKKGPTGAKVQAQGTELPAEIRLAELLVEPLLPGCAQSLILGQFGGVTGLELEQGVGLPGQSGVPAAGEFHEDLHGLLRHAVDQGSGGGKTEGGFLACEEGDDSREFASGQFEGHDGCGLEVQYIVVQGGGKECEVGGVPAGPQGLAGEVPVVGVLEEGQGFQEHGAGLGLTAGPQDAEGRH